MSQTVRVAGVLQLLLCVVQAHLDLTILHTNDMHGRFDETSQNSGTCRTPGHCYGGFARVAHILRTHRNASLTQPGAPATLFLFAGDIYTGTAWFTVHKWRIAVDFMNRLAPDALSFGNHEFDYGIEGVVPYLEHLNYPLVSANTDASKDRHFNVSVPKSVILNVRNVPIGVIGYLLPDTINLSSTGNMTISDEVAAINAESQRLTDEGVRIIIAVGHSGFEMDKKIARECPLVDVVVGGHTNTFLWNGKQPDAEVPEGPYPVMVTQPSNKKVPVVQAYAYTKYVGRLNVTFNDEGELTKAEGQPILLTHNISKEQDMVNALNPYREGVQGATQVIVGKLKVDLPINNCRLEECNFGNLLSDAYVEHQVLQYVGPYWTDCAIALLNGGAIRSAIDRGVVTNGDLLGALPYDMDVVAYNLKGRDLLATLETAVRSNGETSRGEFLQMSGLKVVYDLSRAVGHRVVSVQVRCADCRIPVYAPLNATKTYRIVSSSFIVDGGDGYEVLKTKAFQRAVQEVSEIAIITNYIAKRQSVYPDVSGRIVVQNAQSYLNNIYRHEHLSDKSMATRNFVHFPHILSISLFLVALGNNRS